VGEGSQHHNAFNGALRLDLAFPNCVPSNAGPRRVRFVEQMFEHMCEIGRSTPASKPLRASSRLTSAADRPIPSALARPQARTLIALVMAHHAGLVGQTLMVGQS
jgi:hypothetical protein